MAAQKERTVNIASKDAKNVVQYTRSRRKVVEQSNTHILGLGVFTHSSIEYNICVAKPQRRRGNNIGFSLTVDS